MRSFITSFVLLANFAIGANQVRILGPYDPSRFHSSHHPHKKITHRPSPLVLKPILDVAPVAKPVEAAKPVESAKPVVVTKKRQSKYHEGCWNFRSPDIVVPLNESIKRLLVKCYEQDDWVMEQVTPEQLPKGLRMERETENTKEGLFIRYYLVGSTVDDSRYSEVTFQPKKTPEMDEKPASVAFRIQTGHPRNFSDECATADVMPLLESQTNAPVDYQVALCNADETRDLNVQFTPELPPGIKVQLRRVRPNRMLITLSGSAAKPVHEVYKIRVLRTFIELNPMTVELAIQEPATPVEVAAEPAAEQPATDSQSAAVILNLSGIGEVYLDQKRISVPHQVDLDSEEHVVKVISSGRVEYSRTIPRRDAYKGPSLDIWNIVTTGSVTSFGYQSDREILAAKISEMRKRTQLEKVKGRNPAAVTPGAAPEGRMSLREMDMTVELKLLKQAVNQFRRLR